MMPWIAFASSGSIAFNTLTVPVSSSVFVTFVTDFTGFFAFLGLRATAGAQWAFILGGLVYTLDGLIFLLVGGVVSDRFDRRKILIMSDAIRGVAITTMGILSLTGVIQLWHVIGLAAVFGAASGLSLSALCLADA